MTTLRQWIPLGGVLQLGWHPLSALIIYWLEAVVLAAIAAWSIALVERRSNPDRQRAARQRGQHDLARQFADERAFLKQAQLNSRQFFSFQAFTLFAFALFFAGVLTVLLGNGHVSPPDNPWEVLDGAKKMLVIVGIGLVFDLFVFDLPVQSVQARAQGCLTRFLFFWILGFFGVITMAITGKPTTFFPFFAGLKATFEVLGTINQVFGRRATANATASTETV